ncbi:DEAD-like helicase [Catenulispora acidiphila DSM 44928]|uniref:DEAD-like helicase n=1 Tax=Catenulispora acidiphila (strain DSM 44928 / JCM 14897 / NBRC 102108 / NRRL B-24433 / ID139908) TaxID=479433 RepID=C7QG70_CATAD|nr:DEAD/DEAH box helicase [Catenulispora acidiphila]ACU72915.1 DEAD-like helicase [Catenulispora acidiphila DSM 44928]
MAPLDVDFEARLAAFASSKFTKLRTGQRLVLQEYAATHTATRDLAVEMPTGDGKTLVALLVADLALDEGKSVAYLAGTRQLAAHVQREADALGLDTVRFSGGQYGGQALDDYHQAQAIAVMNYWVYFNGKPVPQPADLVIFDDAHLAEQPLTGMYTLRIPNDDGEGGALYEALCDLVLAHTDSYSSLRAMRDGTALPGTVPELIAFNDWAAIANVAAGVIQSSPFTSGKEATYAWKQVRDRLPRCGVLVGPSTLEIRPYHPPTSLNPWYSKAKQRLYLSATLGTMDDLQRRIGGKQIARLQTAEPTPAASTGRRRLVLNPSSARSLDPEVFDFALSQVPAAGGRTAWLCASHNEADAIESRLRGLGGAVFSLRGGRDEVLEAWRAAPSGHLVTAGRYDGLDLAEDLCRLVVLPTVPQASSEFERFAVAYLGDASFMRHRVGQRITQALGRANRTPTDRALYLALDPAFAHLLADPIVRRSITPDAEPVVREALARHGEGWAGARAACEEFWDPQSDSSADDGGTGAGPRKRRPGRAAGGAAEVHSADNETTASAELWLGGHSAAANAAKAAAAELAAAGESENAAFWRYIEAHAHFDRGRPQDLAQAHGALREAIAAGPHTAWFRRLARTADELDGRKPTTQPGLDDLFLVWDEWVRESGASAIERQLNAARALMTGNHDQQCEALVALARLCGVHGNRPPKTEQSATDCRWLWTVPKGGERRVWEVKTGRPEKIPRGDVNQLLGQIEVERKRAPKTHVTGCLLSPVLEVEEAAAEASRDSITLLHHGAAVQLFDLLADRFRRYVALWEDGRGEARGSARIGVEPLLPTHGWLERLLAPSNGRIVIAANIAELFGHS